MSDAFHGGGVARTTARTRTNARPRTGIRKRPPLVGRDSDILLLDQALDVAITAVLAPLAVRRYRHIG